jgi:hypothetical protein
LIHQVFAELLADLILNEVLTREGLQDFFPKSWNRNSTSSSSLSIKIRKAFPWSNCG